MTKPGVTVSLMDAIRAGAPCGLRAAETGPGHDT